MKEWRSKSIRTLTSRPVHWSEMPRLIEAMMEDGVDAQITDEGIDWSVKGYRVQQYAIGEAWGLTKNQMRRVREYVLENDPWGRLISES